MEHFDDDDFEVRSPECWLRLARSEDGKHVGIPAYGLRLKESTLCFIGRQTSSDTFQVELEHGYVVAFGTTRIKQSIGTFLGTISGTQGDTCYHDGEYASWLKIL